MSPSPFARSPFARYGLAAAIMLLAVLLRAALVPVIGLNVPYLTVYPAMMIVAVTLGTGPGVIATAAGVLLAERYFMAPSGAYNWDLSFAVRGLILLAASLYVARIGRNLRAARVRAEAEAAAARAAEAALRRQVELIDPVRAEIIVQEMQRVVRARSATVVPPSPPAGGLLQSVPDVTGWAVAAVGLLALAGWVSGVTALTSVLPGLPSMKFNTALCLLVAGAALALRERRALRLAGAAIVGGLAALSLAEYLAGADLGVDQLLIHDPGDPQTVPGRMAQATAICFILTGASLLLTGARTRAALWAQQAAALAAGIVGLVALLGYTYGVRQLYGLAGLSSMALPTAAAFVLLGGGLLCARPDGLTGPLLASGPGAQLARRLLPAALLAPAIFGWFHVMAEHTGLVGPELGAGLFALAMILALGAMVWWAAGTLNRADAARRETEAQLRYQATLMDQAQEPLIVRELGGTILFWNRGAEALYGWPAAEALGQRTHVLLRTEGVTPGQIETQLENTGRWEGELVHLARNGRRVIVESRQTATRTADDRLLILESNRDISERKRAEEALRRSNARLDLLAGTASALLRSDAPQNLVEGLCRNVLSFLDCQVFFNFLVDEEAGRLHLNTCAGIPPEEERKIEWLDFGVAVCGCAARDGCRIVAEDIARTPDPRTELVKGYGVQAYACHPLLEEGKVIGTLSFGTRNRTRFTDEELSLMKAVADHVAIAMARQRAQAALRRVNEELEQRVADRTAELRASSRYSRSLIEASLDPLVTISADGKITDVNEASAQATGLPRERLIGTDFSNYFTEPEKAREGYLRVFAEGFVRDYPLAIRHVSGRLTDVLYNATVYRNEAGGVQGVFAAARDVTERKRAEAELARYRDHLEDLVKLRTAELARSNEELQQFAYVASHDLQEPLRAVAGYVSLIERRLGEALDTKVRDHIAGAVQGAARMERLITDLLRLSRVGTQGDPFRPANLAEVLEQVLTDFRTEILASGAVVTSDPLPTLPVDAGQMAQLFGNLIGNALKFRGERPPEIHVSARRDAEHWVLGVRDNGLGIEPQYFERIFVIFQRLHTRKQYPGTGIGLAICKKIVERHGGKIWVESLPGQGSTFYFTLPRENPNH